MDRSRRLLFSKVEIKLILLKYVILKKKLLDSINFEDFLEYASFNLDFYKTRISSTCIVTGRFSSVNRYFKVSRIYLRKLGGFNYMYGLRKSSW